MKLRFLTAALVFALSLALAACGSGSSTSSQATEGTTSAKEQAPPSAPSGSTAKAGGGSKGEGSGSGSAEGSKQSAESPSPEPRFTPRPHHDSAGGSKQFVQKGGDNSVEEYGSERTAGSDFAEAATALHTYLDARAAGAWGAACDALAATMVEQLVSQLAGAADGKASCPEVLAAFNSSVSPAGLREAAEVDVAALRTKGDSGFLLFKGAREEPFFIPVQREGGHWKVGAVGPSPLP